MITKDNKYWYFRTQADEDSDTGLTASIAIPLSSITGIVPHKQEVDEATGAVQIWFKKATSDLAASGATSGVNGSVLLTVTAGRMKEVIAALVATINAGPRSNPSGVTVIADDATIDADNTLKDPIYIHPGIIGCGAISGS
tara:strand:+ start:994 stop:1416 length:423 start_codon:yes stop_codon:yes gene_type:complete